MVGQRLLVSGKVKQTRTRVTATAAKVTKYDVFLMAIEYEEHDCARLSWKRDKSRFCAPPRHFCVGADMRLYSQCIVKIVSDYELYSNRLRYSSYSSCDLGIPRRNHLHSEKSVTGHNQRLHNISYRKQARRSNS